MEFVTHLSFHWFHFAIPGFELFFILCFDIFFFSFPVLFVCWTSFRYPLHSVSVMIYNSSFVTAPWLGANRHITEWMNEMDGWMNLIFNIFCIVQYNCVENGDSSLLVTHKHTPTWLHLLTFSCHDIHLHSLNLAPNTTLNFTFRSIPFFICDVVRV